MTYAAMALGFNPRAALSYEIAYAQSSALNFTVPAGKTKMAVFFIGSGAVGAAGITGTNTGAGGRGGAGGGGVCFADFAVVEGQNFTVPTAGSFIRNNDSFVLANVNVASGSSAGSASINASTVANQKATAAGRSAGAGGTGGGAGNNALTGITLAMNLDGIGVVSFTSGSGGGGGGAGANLTNIGNLSGGSAGTSGTGAGNAGAGGSAFKSSNTSASASPGSLGNAGTITNPLSNAVLNDGLGGGGSGGGGGGARVNSPLRTQIGGSSNFIATTVIRIYFA